MIPEGEERPFVFFCTKSSCGATSSELTIQVHHKPEDLETLRSLIDKLTEGHPLFATDSFHEVALDVLRKELATLRAEKLALEQQLSREKSAREKAENSWHTLKAIFTR